MMIKIYKMILFIEIIAVSIIMQMLFTTMTLRLRALPYTLYYDKHFFNLVVGCSNQNNYNTL